MTENLASPTIVQALTAVMTDVQAVKKGGRNTQQGYSFRGIDAVVNAVGPALRAHGVVVLPVVEDIAYAVVEVGQKRTPMRECTVRVRYRFHGPAGDVLECVSVGEAMDSGDKSTPKAMSVAFRVALLQALCIPTDEPDVDSQSYERAPAESWEVAKPPTPEQVTDAGNLSQALRTAVDEDDLRGLWQKSVKASYDGGFITDAQLKALAAERDQILAELRVGSGDGDRDA